MTSDAALAARCEFILHEAQSGAIPRVPPTPGNVRDAKDILALIRRAQSAEAAAGALRAALVDAGKALRWAIDYGRVFDHLPHCERKEYREAGHVCTCGYDAQEVPLEVACVAIVAALRAERERREE